MARQERQVSKSHQPVDYHQRQVHRNQVVFGILSVFLILSMIISLFRF